MKTKKKKMDALTEYIKANRKGSREAELENHGRPVSYNQVHTSKKVYSRKRMKADDQRRLPFLSLLSRMPSLWHSCAIVVARLCQHRGTTVPQRWHYRKIGMELPLHRGETWRR